MFWMIIKKIVFKYALLSGGLILPAETCLHEAGIYLVWFSFVSLSLSHCLQHRKSGGRIINSEAVHNEVPQNLG